MACFCVLRSFLLKHDILGDLLLLLLVLTRWGRSAGKHQYW